MELRQSVTYSRLERDAQRLVRAHTAAGTAGRDLEAQARELRAALANLSNRAGASLSRLR